MNEGLPHACVVYGGGAFGKELADDLVAVGVEVIAILDQQTKPAHNGIPVMHPAAFRGTEDLPVMMGIFNHQADPRHLMDVCSLGDRRKVWLPTTSRLALGKLGSAKVHFWLADDVSIYHRVTDRVQQARNLLVDQASRTLFDALFECRLTGRISDVLAPPHGDVPYLPQDFDFFDVGPAFLVDAGAYIGDTVTSLLEAGVDLESVMALEPDPYNFRRLHDTLDMFDTQSIALPLGLWSSTRQLRFAGADAAGSISESGKIHVQCVALDDVLNGILPSHIKMDIEGAELQALEGMQVTVAAANSRLAVSVYHSPQDLWELPLAVERLWPGRRMLLRQHGFFGFDTVLYVMDSVT